MTSRLPAPETTSTDPLRRSLLGHQPAALEAFRTLYADLWARGVVDHVVKEIVRLRNARITDCGY